MRKLTKYLLIIIIFYTTIIQPAIATQYLIAIDPGHGGKDSGAIGPKRLYEKTVTLAISKKLYSLLSRDPNFKPVLTRNSDYFISVPQRSEIARNKKADFLISIHADAAPNHHASGASVWVLSNKRADSELGRWLEQHEKQSELLGGAGDVLAKERNPYLSQAIIDLQFAYAQRVGYDLATHLLTQIKAVSRLHKSRPEHASLGVLRSPDIPSVLIEVGFISNPKEEALLKTNNHQSKIATAIYRGLKNFIKTNPKQK